MTESEILEEFEARGIVFEKLEHAAVHTVEESTAIHQALPAAHTKNLFLKDKQGRYWLITLPSDRRADLKAMAQLLGAGKFSFGKAEDMERLLHVTPGAVTPLAAVNADAGTINLVLDAGFADADRIAIHPLRNTATIALPVDQLTAWLTEKGVAPQMVALP